MGCFPPRQALPAAMMSLLLSLLPTASPAAADQDIAFADRFMFRLSAYDVQDADTDIMILSDDGIGTEVSFVDDLGGDPSVTIPRIDAYYRFDLRHRIDFGAFRVNRDGRTHLDIDVIFDDEHFFIDDDLKTEIDYGLFKVGYSFSFYHSPTVELGVSFGLNVTEYDFSYQLADGSSADRSDASAPLPMFGMRMGYKINARWSVHYLSEIFFIEIDNKLEGSFLNAELDFEYKFSNHYVFGFGFSRFSIDLDSDGDSWKGRISDSHQGVSIFASYRL
jgi:hypothetical protein